MCPNASIMPSLARTRLATASSWRSSANESGMVGFSVCGGGPGEWRVANRRVAGGECVALYSPCVIPMRAGGVPVSGAADPAEEIGEFVLDLLPHLGARARDHGKTRKPLEWPAGIDDGARIGRA